MVYLFHAGLGPTQVVLEKSPLNGCSIAILHLMALNYEHTKSKNTLSSSHTYQRHRHVEKTMSMYRRLLDVDRPMDGTRVDQTISRRIVLILHDKVS